jgi:PIN domain nuclease of toxin-antitoxin system
LIVLDTHVLLWWASDSGQLSRNARAAIDGELADENGILLISTITAWEIAMLVKAERLTLTMGVDDWLATVAEIDAVHFMPLEIAVAIESTRLPGLFHKDPADRMIVALARHHSAALVTADSKIRDYAPVKTIW